MKKGSNGNEGNNVDKALNATLKELHDVEETIGKIKKYVDKSGRNKYFKGL